MARGTMRFRRAPSPRRLQARDCDGFQRRFRISPAQLRTFLANSLIKLRGGGIFVRRRRRHCTSSKGDDRERPARLQQAKSYIASTSISPAAIPPIVLPKTIAYTRAGSTRHEWEAMDDIADKKAIGAHQGAAQGQALAAEAAREHGRRPLRAAQ